MWPGTTGCGAAWQRAFHGVSGAGSIDIISQKITVQKRKEVVGSNPAIPTVGAASVAPTPTRE